MDDSLGRRSALRADLELFLTAWAAGFVFFMVLLG